MPGSSKNMPILYSKLLNKMGHYFLDRRYYSCSLLPFPRNMFSSVNWTASVWKFHTSCASSGVWTWNIIVGNSDIGAHLRYYLGYLSCLRNLFRSRVVSNWMFFLRKDPFFFMRTHHVLSYHLVWVAWAHAQRKLVLHAPGKGQCQGNRIYVQRA